MGCPEENESASCAISSQHFVSDEMTYVAILIPRQPSCCDAFTKATEVVSFNSSCFHLIYLFTRTPPKPWHKNRIGVCGSYDYYLSAFGRSPEVAMYCA